MRLYRTLPAALLFSCSASVFSSEQKLTQTLAEQVTAMPADFREHFYNAPLSTRVYLNGKLLGNAIVVFTDDEHMQLTAFTDAAESTYSEAERQRWYRNLSSPFRLGKCESQCKDGLQAVDYRLSNAQLSIFTAGSADGKSGWHTLPETAETGLILNNQLSATGGEKQNSALGWLGGFEAGIGNWTAINQFQLDRNSGADASSRYAVSSLYLLRESQNTFYRIGLFMPDSQGVLRQPYSQGGWVSTLVGVMAGSSDALLKDGDTPSLFPVYVTANREGVAQVYRNGTLINTQPVVPGLQTLDTAPLPGGIYEVEIRVLEDGQETSRTTETINKPANWRTPGQRLRYNVFAGRQESLWSNTTNRDEEKPAAGASVNYLVLPALTAGAALQKTGREQQAGLSMDWQIGQQQLYGNVWRSSVAGVGFDTQMLWLHDRGNVAVNYSLSRPDSTGWQNDSRRHAIHTTSLSSTWLLSLTDSITGRISHTDRSGAPGLDLSYNTRSMLAGKSINWRLAGYDRPYREGSTLRNRGAALSMSFSLGTEGRSVSASVGSRSDSQGARDLYASASVNQEWQHAFFRNTSLTATADRHGAGFSTHNQFDAPVATGSFWGQSSSMDNRLSGGVNLGSTLALGGGKAVMSAQTLHHEGSGLIIDVISDDPTAHLLAYHSGGSTSLSPGKNFIPVNAWKPGNVQLDFPGTEAPPLKIWPQYLDYHMVRGGVQAKEVRVMKTLTVMGRLTDKTGLPLGGARMINHAGHTISESDGIFALELHENNPVINIEHHSGLQCDIHLNPAEQKREDMIFMGNVACDDGVIAEKTPVQTAKVK